MIGDLLNNNKRREVRTRADQVMFMGKKYRQDKRTGYYVCTTGKKRQRLHVAIWINAWGWDVPPGCVIHHLDWDKTNNDIANLFCVTHEEHERIHNIIGGEAGKEYGYELMRKRGLRSRPTP